MANKKTSIQGEEDVPIPKLGPRFIRPKFGPVKRLQIESLAKPPVYNGDESVQNVQREFLLSRRKLDRTKVVTAERKELLLSEGLRELDEQWNSLDKKENQFRIVVRKFNKFVKENLIKRERFENGFQRSQEHFKKYNAETEKMQEKVSYLQRILQQMKAQITKHSIYEDFLWRVVAVSVEFKTLYSFLSRFNVLIATLDDTTALFGKDKSLLLLLLHKLDSDAHKRIITINELMNRLCQLGPTLNDLKIRNRENDKIICDVHREATKSMADVQGTLEFLNQLYRYVCSRERKQVLYSDGDYKNQLTVIKRTLVNFEKVLKVCQAGE